MSESQRMESLELYFSGYEQCSPGHFAGPGIRNHYLMHFVMSGRGRFQVAGKSYELGTGSLFLIRPKELTYYEADKKDPWEYCWLAFGGAEVDSLLNRCGFDVSPVYRELPEQAQQVYLTIFREDDSNRGNPLLYRGLLYQFFSFLLQQTDSYFPVGARDYFKKAKQYICTNYAYDISVAGVAAHVGVDRSYLYRLFRQWMRMSPQQFLRQCRLEAAQKLLTQTDHTVTEIAYSCGFRDVASFDKAFRAVVRMSPTAYRRCSSISDFPDI